MHSLPQPAACLTLRDDSVSVFVQVEHALHVTRTTHNDRAPVMDLLWHDIKHTPNLAEVHARGCHSSRLLRDHRHGKALVEDSQLALLRLLVRWVEEDTAVEQGAVHVRDHGANVSGGIARLFAFRHEVLDGLVPGVGVPLIAREDFLTAALGHLHLLDEDELANGGIQGKAEDPRPIRDDQLCCCTEHAVARGDALGAWPKNVLHSGRAVIRALTPVDRKDRADAHIAVDVG
mmetsp:Transcript_62445/g.135561  ORF Transcript_62445/g.135561 Transcript_62445/m.135561 type:complete len:233 (+) Transcript_62445:73-771(+)